MSLTAMMLRGRVIAPPLRRAHHPVFARPLLAHQLVLRSKWHTTAVPTSAEETSIPLGNDKGHISKAEGESIAFFDREFLSFCASSLPT